MRPVFVVVLSPGVDDFYGVSQISKSVFVEAFVPEFAVETLHIGVLCRLAGLYQFQLNAMVVGPLIQGFTREFRGLIRSDRSGVAPELRDGIQGSNDLIVTGISNASLVKASTMVNVFNRRPSPASSSFKIPMICSSVNRFFIMSAFTVVGGLY